MWEKTLTTLYSQARDNLRGWELQIRESTVCIHIHTQLHIQTQCIFQIREKKKIKLGDEFKGLKLFLSLRLCLIYLCLWACMYVDVWRISECMIRMSIKLFKNHYIIILHAFNSLFPFLGPTLTLLYTCHHPVELLSNCQPSDHFQGPLYCNQYTLHCIFSWLGKTSPASHSDFDILNYF